MYLPVSSGFSLENNLYDITLAKDAINVPKPPIFTANNKSDPYSVNPDNKMAAGTLLII